MWDKIERVINNLDWYLSMAIGLILSGLIGFAGEWAIMSLFIFTLISTYFIQIVIIYLFKFMLKKKKIKENEIPENIMECFKMVKSEYMK